MPGRRIVIAVDPSSASTDAVHWVAEKLLNNEDEVHLVSVLEAGHRSAEAVFESGHPMADDDCQPNPLALEQRCSLLKSLRKQLSQHGAKDVQLTTLVSCVGGSADLGRHICEYSAEKNADLVVLGSRGMGSGQKRILGLFGLGSVSDFVVNHAPVPNVLVHKVKTAVGTRSGVIGDAGAPAGAASGAAVGASLTVGTE